MDYRFILQSLKITSQKGILVDISFDLQHSLALVGQSGSGKSLTLKAILNLLPSGLTQHYKLDTNFEQNPNNIAYVPQNPFTSLSPLTKIKDQFFIDTNQQKKICSLVGLDHKLLDHFPSQLSGGQLQRVVIAIALSTNPKLLLLDEPTTALDHTTKTSIIQLIQKLQAQLRFKLIFVTHDIYSVVDLCKDIIILQNGKIIEQGTINSILNDPQSPYTKKLIASSFNNRAFRV